VGDEARLEEMLAAACLHAGTEAAFTSNLRGFLSSFGIANEDIEAILAAPPRLALYRRLVRNNLRGVTEKMLARTRARLNEIADGAFDASFAAWLDEAGPRTHYLRDVPGDFLIWAGPRWRGRTDVPAWIADLARYEIAQYQVAASAKAPAEVTEIAPERPLVFAEAVMLLRLGFAVHALPSGVGDRTVPAAEATALLIYRDEDHAVQLLELTPFAAAITERLLAGTPLLDAVREAAAIVSAKTAPLDVARFLADLAGRRILLGGRP
jgi:hypothetical protein